MRADLPVEYFMSWAFHMAHLAILQINDTTTDNNTSIKLKKTLIKFVFLFA